jgi:hypothetical protein
MKKRSYLFLAALCGLISCTKTEKLTLLSPDNQFKLETFVTPGKELVYSLTCNGETVLEESKIGLKVNDTDFSSNLQITSISPVEAVSDEYNLANNKRSHCNYSANRSELTLAEKDGLTLKIIFQLANNGLAFRYELSSPDNLPKTVKAEATTFNLPDQAKAWLHPHAVAQTGWAKTQPSYEEYYEMNIPVGTESNFGQGWSFPALFQSGKFWIQLTEADMGRTYCGSHLAHLSPNGEYRVAFPQAPEKTTPDSALFPESDSTIESPWRIVTVGQNLGTIVESTLTTDLSKPAITTDQSFLKPGKASWSWVLLKDGQTTYDVQKKFIDYAADMNWGYCLIDALWDSQIGYDKIKELADYAATKNVGIILWYNSNGNWNDAPQTPIHKMFDPETRKKEFEILKEMGIKGLKIDFFGGDGQSFMNYYQDLLETASAYGILMNFHGTTIPRGWTRTYPNLMTMESVRGMEFLTFEQANTDHEPTHCAILPFTRNAVEPMDFTPVCFSEIPNLERRTTNGFELALSVLFQSGIQHYAEIPEGMYAQPDYVIDFMRTLPESWDDIKFIDGFPGEFAVLARKGKDKWYIAGINGTDETKDITINLADFGFNANAALITDGENDRSFEQDILTEPETSVSIVPHGGFVMTVN